MDFSGHDTGDGPVCQPKREQTENLSIVSADFRPATSCDDTQNRPPCQLNSPSSRPRESHRAGLEQSWLMPNRAWIA